MKIVSLTAALLLCACSARKSEKLRLERDSHTAFQSSHDKQWQQNALKIDSSKTFLTDTDNSQIFETQDAEITADWAHVDFLSGGALLKGNVKISGKKGKTSRMNKAATSRVESHITEKTALTSKTQSGAEIKQYDKTKTFSKKTTAKRPFFLGMIAIIIAAITIIYFKKWRR